MTRNARRVHRAYQQGYTRGWWRGWGLAIALALGGVVGGHVAAQWRGAHQALSGSLAPGATITITPRQAEEWLVPMMILPTCADCLEL